MPLASSALLIALSVVASSAVPASVAPPPAPLAPPHDLTFWRQLAQNKYAVPPGSDLAALTAELVDMLASPDADARDEIAYTALATWIYQTRVIGEDALRPLTDRLLRNLTDGIGERGT